MKNNTENQCGHSDENTFSSVFPGPSQGKTSPGSNSMALVHAVCRHCCVQVSSVDASGAGDRVEAGLTDS